jgi:S-methylmethionine-dependent homocysteine/selenocysteine methylase
LCHGRAISRSVHDGQTVSNLELAMTKYRHQLPQISDRVFLTDGGIETTLIYHDGLDLPYFAAFHLLKDRAGRDVVKNYFRRHIAIAREQSVGFVLESATWRANPDWAVKLGYAPEALAEANRDAITMLHELREEYETADTPVVISGCIGPRGDGYKADRRMTAGEAQAYHAPQARVFADAGADIVTAITMTYADEAIGVANAAFAVGLPAVISFTVETDGRLPSGETIAAAIGAVDDAATSHPAYYMINCAHPSHFADQFTPGDPWVRRVRGIRANASRKSHAELDQATELDIGDPIELGSLYRGLRERYSHFNVLGGCCGTDHRHIRAICTACVPPN